MNIKTNTLLFSAFLIFGIYSILNARQLDRKVSELERKLKETEEASYIQTPDRSIEEKYEVLGKLSADVQISFFGQLLGNAKYINFSEDETRKEYLFVDSEFYVQAITDSNDKVLSYAVTSKSESFNPSILVSNVSVVLYKTSFADISKEFAPEECILFLGNTAPSYYFEYYNLGNPSRYQSYLIGINDSAFDKVWEGPDESLYSDYGTTKENDSWFPSINCGDLSRQARKESFPNTYMVFSISSHKSDFPFGDRPGEFLYGPNRIQLQQN